MENGSSDRGIALLVNTLNCFMTLHRIQGGIHISFAERLSTTAELMSPKLLH